MIRWQAHRVAVQSLAFDPRTGLLATATGGTKFAHLWDPRTGILVRKVDAGAPAGSVAFAPDAPLAAAATVGGVRVWETAGWAAIADLPGGHYHEVAVGPGDRPAVAASNAEGVWVWRDAAGSGGRPADHRLGRPGWVPVCCLDFAPDGQLGTNNTVTTAVWDVATGERLADWPRRSSNGRGPIRFSPDGRRAAYGFGKRVTVRRVYNPAGALELTVPKGIVWAAAWSADGRTLLTAGDDGMARSWDPDAGTPRGAYGWGLGKLYSAAFAPDGQTAAAGGQTGEVVVWDVDG